MRIYSKPRYGDASYLLIRLFVLVVWLIIYYNYTDYFSCWTSELVNYFDNNKWGFEKKTVLSLSFLFSVVLMPMTYYYLIGTHYFKNDRFSSFANISAFHVTLYIIYLLKLAWRNGRPWLEDKCGTSVKVEGTCSCSYDTPNALISETVALSMIILVELRMHLKRLKRREIQNQNLLYCIVFTLNLLVELYSWVSPFIIIVIELYKADST